MLMQEKEVQSKSAFKVGYPHLRSVFYLSSCGLKKHYESPDMVAIDSHHTTKNHSTSQAATVKDTSTPPG